MEFINLTQQGHNRTVTFNVQAIAAFHSSTGFDGDGCIVFLVGGESLKVTQSRDEIERLISQD